MAKIYLSPAAHGTDNATRCPAACGENVHCNQYMDIVEARLRKLGFAVKRGDSGKSGSAELQRRVKEANAWGADIYYVAHTNAGGGRYSMTMCYTDAASKAKADVIHQYRRCVKTHKVVQSSSLYEIVATAMTCLYDELIFHDNGEDCAWFHSGGMEQLAEETVQALCQICKVSYVPAGEPSADQAQETASVPKKTAPKAGDKVTLTAGRLYISSGGSQYVTRTGTFYIYDGEKVKGRYRVTNRADRVGKKPVALFVSGWVEI